MNTPIRTAAAALALTALSSLAQADPLATHNPTIRDGLCVGYNCADSEIFLNDELILKDNTIRMFFDDVSTSTPKNDWRILINDGAGQPGEYFAIQDATRGAKVMELSAGAPENSLFMSNRGLIGLGTSLPRQELHIVRSRAPTIRLDQSGGSAENQIWDIVGSDEGFLVSDISTGATPVEIGTGAPSGSLTVRPNGFVGFGTRAPQEVLHLQTTAQNVDAFALFDAAGAGADAAFRLRQQGTVPTTWEFRNQQSSGRLNVGIAGGNTPFKIDDMANNNLLKLGLNGKPDVVAVTGRLMVNNTQMSVPDYVFADDYVLRPLAEVEAFIDANSHLPEVPSAADIARDGLDVPEMQMTLLKKVEELTLYTLALQKEQAALVDTNAALAARLAELEARATAAQP